MPDLIDYEGDSTEHETNLWTHKAFRKYFADCYWTAHLTGGTLPWTIKETVLLKTMIREFSPTDLAKMIVYWHKTTPKSSVACRFDNFYCNRIELYHNMKEEAGEYSWE